MDDYKIRAFRISDKPTLLNIVKLNTPKYFTTSQYDDFKLYLKNSVEKYFVIESPDGIIGAGGINFNDYNKEGRISWDFIHPEHHGKGIGQKLLNYRISLLNSMEDIEKITVRTSKSAYMFYEKNGFQLQNIVMDYWAKGLDLYRMKYEGDL